MAITRVEATPILREMLAEETYKSGAWPDALHLVEAVRNISNK